MTIRHKILAKCSVFEIMSVNTFRLKSKFTVWWQWYQPI